MHVFLTGDRGIGKSRAVQRTAELLRLPCYGFVTRFQGADRHASSLYLLPAAGPGTMDEGHVAARWENGRLQPVPHRFDTLGAALLREARGHPEGLILMDECGHLEKQAWVFQREILLCLEGSIPVLGVLRKDQPWHDFIRAHPRVVVLNAAEGDRETLPQRIAGYLKEGAE